MFCLISASIVGYIGMIWVIGLTIIMHYLGRKKTVQIVSLNSTVGFLVLYCSKNATHVLISHIIHGMLAASQTTISLLVLTEYSSPKYRGLFLTLKSATFFWGIWVANAIGAFYNFRNIGIIGVLCSVYNFTVLLIIPESPYWLVGKEKYDECVKSHRWLRGEDVNTEKELEILINAQKDFKSRRKAKKSIKDHFFKTVHNISRSDVYKPILLSVLVMALYHVSGKLVCTIYAIQIIKKITHSESTAYTGMLILDGITVLGMYFGCGLSKVLKRRVLLLSAATIGTIFLYVLSVYLFIVKHGYISENNYVSIALLTGFSLAICCGPMILTTSIYGELVPLRARGICVILVSLFAKFSLSTSLKISPYLFQSIGYHGTFLFFAVMSTLVLIIIYYVLPETKDKTLHEIAGMFNKEKSIEPVELTSLNKNGTRDE